MNVCIVIGRKYVEMISADCFLHGHGSMEESSLKEKTAKGLFWGGFSNGMQQLLNLFFGIFLARLLSPSDYGLVGMLTIFTLIAGSLQESGFISAITNRRDVTSNDYNAVFWFSILVSASVYVLLFFCAPLIARFYDEPKLIPLSRFIFLCFVLSSTTTAHSAYLFRNLMVKKRTIAQLSALAVSGTIGVTAAYNGLAYWGIALQSVTYVLVSSMCYWVLTPWRPSFHVDFRPLREMFGFSSRVLATNIFIHINNNIFSVLLGRLFSAAQVGYYTQAAKWNMMGYNTINGMIVGVAQPVLSQVADDRVRQLAVFRKMLRFTAFCLFSADAGACFHCPGTDCRMRYREMARQRTYDADIVCMGSIRPGARIIFQSCHQQREILHIHVEYHYIMSAANRCVGIDGPLWNRKHDCGFRCSEYGLAWGMVSVCPQAARFAFSRPAERCASFCPHRRSNDGDDLLYNTGNSEYLPVVGRKGGNSCRYIYGDDVGVPGQGVA